MSSTSGTQNENPYSYDGAAAPVRSGKASERMDCWYPTNEVTLHNGNQIPATMIFPFFPPAEIGQIYTANSNWHTSLFAKMKHDEINRLYKALAFSCFFTAAIFAILSLTGIMPWPRSLNGFYLIAPIPIVYLFIGIIITFFRVRLLWRCEFVGENGYWIFKKFGPFKTTKKVLFEDCKEITSGLNHFPATASAKLDLLYHSEGAEHLELTHDKIRKLICRIGTSVELAWAQYVLRRIAERVSQGEQINFNASERITFQLTQDGLFAMIDQRKTAMSLSNVKRASVDFWKFELVLGGEPEFIKDNTVSFSWTSIPNGRALLIILENRLGITIEQKYFELCPSWYPAKWKK